MKIAIVTATYNRANMLPNLYESLCEQNNKDFIWIIIDDGSTDNTESLIEEFRNRNIVKIRYIKQKNSGKHKALNTAFAQNEDIDFFTVIDSDDRADVGAIDNIRSEVERFADNHDIGVISFFQRFESGEILNFGDNKTRKTEMVLNAYDYNAKYNRTECCNGFFKRAVEKYSFPVFDGEKFMGESVLALQIAKEFDTFYSIKVVTVVEYQEGGLTRLGRKYRLKNPLGMLVYCSLKMNKRNPSIIDRLKNAVAAQAYAINSGIDNNCLMANGIKPDTLKKWAKPFGKLLLLFWNR